MKGLIIETVSYTISTLYNYTNDYRLMNYFEYVILLIQNYALIFIVLFYRKQINQKFLMAVGIYVFVALLFSTSILPKSILTLLIVRLISFKNQFTNGIFLAWYLTDECNIKNIAIYGNNSLKRLFVDLRNYMVYFCLYQCHKNLYYFARQR